MKKILAAIAVVVSLYCIARAFTTVTLNGQQYLVPSKGDTNYSQGVNSLNQFLIAIPGGFPQVSGGTMTGNLTFATGAEIMFTSANSSVWSLYVDNNGNLNRGNLSAGTTSFVLINSTSAVQAGTNPTLWVSSGTISGPFTATGQTTVGATASTTTVVGPLGIGTPSAVGASGQVLQSNGNGVAPGWVSPGGVYILNQNTLQAGATAYISSGTITNLNVTTENYSNGAPSFNGSNGRILQNVYCKVSISSTTTSNAGVFDKSNIGCTITPKLSTSIIRVSAGIQADESNPLNGKSLCEFQIWRSSSTLISPSFGDACGGGGAAASATNTFCTTPLFFPDSPASVSATVYGIYFSGEGSGGGCVVNSNNNRQATSWMNLDELGQ